MISSIESDGSDQLEILNLEKNVSKLKMLLLKFNRKKSDKYL
jgi:hypothetical protein